MSDEHQVYVLPGACAIPVGRVVELVKYATDIGGGNKVPAGSPELFDTETGVLYTSDRTFSLKKGLGLRRGRGVPMLTETSRTPMRVIACTVVECGRPDHDYRLRTELVLMRDGATMYPKG